MNKTIISFRIHEELCGVSSCRRSIKVPYTNLFELLPPTSNHNLKEDSARDKRPCTALNIIQRTNKNKRAIIRVDRVNAFPLRLTRKNFHLNELFIPKLKANSNFNTSGLSRLVVKGAKQMIDIMASSRNKGLYYKKTPTYGAGRKLIEQIMARRNSRNRNKVLNKLEKSEISKTMEVRVRLKSERKHLDIILPRPGLKLPKFLIE